METSLMWTEFKSNPSPALKQKIVINYIKLVHYVIHNSRFANLDIFDDRDYFQFGIEGLSEAIDRFDPEFGTKFETYAIQRIRGKIIDELRKVQKNYRSGASGKNDINIIKVSLDHSFDDDEGYMLYETIPNDSEIPDEIAEKNEAKELLIEAIKNLNERDRLVLTLYYYENLTYKEISESLNITVSRISQIHTRITEQLKEKLAILNE